MLCVFFFKITCVLLIWTHTCNPSTRQESFEFQARLGCPMKPPFKTDTLMFTVYGMRADSLEKNPVFHSMFAVIVA